MKRSRPLESPGRRDSRPDRIQVASESSTQSCRVPASRVTFQVIGSAFQVIGLVMVSSTQSAWRCQPVEVIIKLIKLIFGVYLMSGRIGPSRCV